MKQKITKQTKQSNEDNEINGVYLNNIASCYRCNCYFWTMLSTVAMVGWGLGSRYTACLRALLMN